MEELIKYARSLQATDIHFMVYTKSCLIKLRINEQLIDHQEMLLNDYQKLIVFIKYKSNMNLNSSKSPQSSAFNIPINDETIRVRVSTLPSNGKESLVLRLHHHTFQKPIRDLLMFPALESIFLKDVSTNGLILITGPTCSGKTTLSYSLLNHLKEKGLSVVSVEDPVEHYETGLVQLQINESAGVTYETSVKEILRHDPDVIFIGEIRDALTAKSAIRASLTGHLVISTMHATDCLKAIYRFLEFGLSLIDLEQTFRLVSNQRLIIQREQKKILFEYLDSPKLHEALTMIKKGGELHYKKLTDYLKEVNDVIVMKE